MGFASASQRGTVIQPAIRKLLLKLTDNLDVPKILKSFTGYSFKGDNLPDIVPNKPNWFLELLLRWVFQLSKMPWTPDLSTLRETFFLFLRLWIMNA